MVTRSVRSELAHLRNREAVGACSRGREPTESRLIQIESREAAAARCTQRVAVTPSGVNEYRGLDLRADARNNNSDVATAIPSLTFRVTIDNDSEF
jgi:hypothetical protein